jgi:phosphotransferase system HPr (HPr) family protein
MRYAAAVTVGVGEREADAKSLLAVLGLGARRGTELRLRAEGREAMIALDALAACISGLSD